MRISNIRPVLHIRSLRMSRRIAIGMNVAEELRRYQTGLAFRWRDAVSELRNMWLPNGGWKY